MHTAAGGILPCEDIKVSSSPKAERFLQSKFRAANSVFFLFFLRVFSNIGTFQLNIAELCKGSTADSDSVCLGSNPSSAAKKENRSLWSVLFFDAEQDEPSVLPIGQNLGSVSPRRAAAAREPTASVGIFAHRANTLAFYIIFASVGVLFAILGTILIFRKKHIV